MSQTTIALAPRTGRDFEWILPQPVWRSTTTGIGLAHAGGEEFRAARDGLTCATGHMGNTFVRAHG